MSSVEALARDAMRAADVPGLAIAVVDARQTSFIAGFGCADLSSRARVEPTTRFMLGSTAKPVGALAIGALVSRRMLELDIDVQRWLGFRVRHPAFPDVPITMRSLLEHRSSIRDDLGAMRASVTAGDCPVGLADWLRARLGAGDAFDASAPGTSELYSNTGWALAALVAERAADMGFADLCEALVFRPLGIARASWRLGARGAGDLARPYAGGFGQQLEPVDHYGYPDYPSGSLRISALELARVVRLVLARGTLDDQRVVEPEWIDERFGWRALDGSRFGQDGLDRGVGTRIIVDPRAGSGAVILGNAAWTYPAERAEIFADLEAHLLELGARSAGREIVR